MKKNGWAGYVPSIEYMRNAHINLVRKPQAKRPLEIPMHR
jgi:hypothetical protein